VTGSLLNSGKSDFITDSKGDIFIDEMDSNKNEAQEDEAWIGEGESDLHDKINKFISHCLLSSEFDWSINNNNEWIFIIIFISFVVCNPMILIKV
jgi:hypothetical protein